MKKQLNIKKLILLNMPYMLLGRGAGAGDRRSGGIPEPLRCGHPRRGELDDPDRGAAESEWLHLFAPAGPHFCLHAGLCCCGGLRLAVYLKSKNAKKYRHGMEYGSARWSA